MRSVSKECSIKISIFSVYYIDINPKDLPKESLDKIARHLDFLLDEEEK